MGLFGMWRHHLQNEANRAVIASGRRQRQADRAARLAAGQAKAATLDGYRQMTALMERWANRTQVEYADELDATGIECTERGEDERAETFRVAADYVRHVMTSDEYEQYRQRFSRHDGAGANDLARLARQRAAD